MANFEMSEAERKTIKGELNELLNPKNGDDEERRQTLSAQEVVEQPDVAQLIESVAKLNWTEASGKCFVGSGFLAKITLGVEDRLGFFTAGHNLYDKGTKQLVKASDIKLRFKDIRKHTIKVAFSKFLRQNYLLIVANKTTKIISRNGQESTQRCRKGLDFGAVIFTDPVDRAARFLSRLGLSYLQVASPGACSSAPTMPVQLVGFPQYEENYSPMRILPGNELVVPPGNIPDHSYDLETEPGASGGSVLDKAGRVVAVHIRGQNIMKGDQGNWGLGFDLIREELQLCLNIPSLPSQDQPGTSDPHNTQGMPSVVRFLKNLKLDKYISAFEEHHIDMDVLEDCEPEELEPMLENLEVSFGHRKKIIKALKHETQEKKKQMKKEQEREENQLENIGVNETAAASNVKMSCGVIIGIIVAVIAVIAPYYYKGGAIDGGWSSWTECSHTCKDGALQTRTCTNPKPQYGGNDCYGSTSQLCNQNIPCRIDGGWSSWTECSQICKDGALQTRTCTNPKPQHGGNDCSGSTSQLCNQNIPCRIDGGWSSWTECSHTCKDGALQTRTCTNPKPQYGGNDCYGSTSQLCNQNIPCRRDQILIESEGGAAEWVGHCLGYFDVLPQLYGNSEKLHLLGLTNRPAYQHRGGSFYLFYHEDSGNWLVGRGLGETTAAILIDSNAHLPPTSGWKHSYNKGNWTDEDDTLTLLHNPGDVDSCSQMTVSSTGPAAALYSSSMGHYTWTGQWMSGRKVFSNGDKFLWVGLGYTFWGIGLERKFKDVWIASGRATTCPCSEHAGPSRRFDNDGWRYKDNGRWKVDMSIKVTCD